MTSVEQLKSGANKLIRACTLNRSNTVLDILTSIFKQVQVLVISKPHAGFLLRAGTRVIYPAMAVHVPAIVEEGRFLLFLASANDRHAFALNIAASTSHRQVSER